MTKNRAERDAEFERIWTSPEGIGGWFASVNNQPYGSRFMVAALVFFLLAGVMSLLMRIQLAVPDNDFMGPQTYNRLFTMHGSTMMFLVILPFLEGIAIYLLPQIIGSREMAFPRMSAFSFWVFLSGGLIFFTGFLFNAVPDAGWFVYPPLSLEKYSDLGVDFLLLGLGFIEIAGIGTGIEIVATILKLRAPGMSLGRMPIFAWTWLVTGIMIIFAFSTLFGSTVLIEFDRAIGTKFFVAEAGGNPVLWQHLFWFFGHPDVYIMFLPATGFVTMMVPTFARRPIAGYPLIVVAVLTTGFLSFGLWVHHMFTTGLPVMSSGFFVVASLMIGLASSVQVFAWIATLWRTDAERSVPMLYVFGFMAIFVLGGLTGLMVAVLPFDLQAHDTYFVVAHFHYVLIGGVIFPILAAIHYWLPLFTGYLTNEKLGRLSFWFIFLGFNATFFPMHIAGLLGMSRRVYTYSATLGIGWINMLSTVASFFLAAGFLMVAFNVFYYGLRGQKARRNPWNSHSLEWLKTFDMANYIYKKPPVIQSREPLRDDEETAPAHLRAIAEAMNGEPHFIRATLVTDTITGEPIALQGVAGPSYLPFIAACGVVILSIATLAKAYLLALLGLVFSLCVVAYWIWPKEKERAKLRHTALEEETGLSLEPTGSDSVIWCAMVGTITVIAVCFAVLFYSYFYLRLYSSTWPQGGIALPGLRNSVLAYIPFILGTATFCWGERAHRRKKTSWPYMTGSAALGLLSIVLMTFESLNADFSATVNAYASLFHAITWHMAFLVGIAVVFLLSFLAKLFTSDVPFSATMVLHRQVVGLLWYFTLVISFLVYGVLYLVPRVL